MPLSIIIVVLLPKIQTALNYIEKRCYNMCIVMMVRITRNPKENILHDFVGKIFNWIQARKVILLNYQNNYVER